MDVNARGRADDRYRALYRVARAINSTLDEDDILTEYAFGVPRRA